MNLSQTIDQCSLVVLDLETSGKFPVESDICEIAAVKYLNGQVIDTYQTLVKPREPMSDFVIGIHNITNEMVENSPAISDVIENFWNFCKNSVCVAHHAPFDLGFLSYDFERFNLGLPSGVNLCTSLLARALISETANHRLQTLVQFLKIEPGAAHRALDDTKSCLAVLQECIRRASLNTEVTLESLLKIQGPFLKWSDFSMNYYRQQDVFSQLVMATEAQTPVMMTYGGGSKAGKPRWIHPISIVRNPEGDFLVAFDTKETNKRPKRYYMNKVLAIEEVSS